MTTDTRTTIPTDGLLVVEVCWCGIQHAIPQNMDRWARQSRDNAVFCPLGHKWVVGHSEEQKRKEAEAREVHLKDQLEAAGRAAEAARALLMRDRHRFANGVCPCCNRSFEAVARHIRQQHPDYDLTDMKATRYACSCGRDFETPRGLRVHQGHARPTNWWKPSLSRWAAHLTVTA